MKHIVVIVLCFCCLITKAQLIPPLGSPGGNSQVGSVFTKQLVVPVYADTTSANNAFLWDKLGTIIQIKTTGAVYQRDTVLTGGHIWTQAAANGNIATVANVTALSAYSKGAPVVFVTDTLQGGFFVYTTASLVKDSAIVFPATGIGTGFWQRQRTQVGVYLCDWWGIKRDSSKDESAKIQQAINFVNRRGGGELWFTNGIYIGADTIKDNIRLRGSFRGYVLKNTASWNSFHNVEWVAPAAGGIIITTPDPPTDGTLVAVADASISGFTFVGQGASVPCIAIRLNSWRQGTIEGCTFRYFADEAIYQDNPSQSADSTGITVRNGAINIDNCLAIDCNMDTTTSHTISGRRFKGVFEMWGNDGTITRCTISGSANPAVVGNGNLYGIYSNAGNIVVTDHTIVQKNDIGIKLDSNAVRAYIGAGTYIDRSNRQGLMLTAATECIIDGVVVSRASQELNGGYPAIELNSNSRENQIKAVRVTRGGGGNSSLPNYAIKEVLSDTNSFHKNLIELPSCIMSTDVSVGIYSSSSQNSSYVQGNENLWNDSTTNGILNVNSLNFIKLVNGVTITDIQGGTPFQQIELYMSVATTINNTSTIVLIAGANTTYAVNRLVTLRYIGTKWYEVSSTEHYTAGSGITFSGSAITNNLISGVLTAQTVLSSTTSTHNLTLAANTSNDGKILLGFTATSAYVESTGYLGIGTLAPAAYLQVGASSSSFAVSTNGGFIRVPNIALNDPTNSGTFSSGALSYLGTTTVTSTSVVTYPTLPTLAIKPPVASGNVTITTPLALRLDGNMMITTLGTGVLHTISTGLVSTSLIVAADITANTITYAKLQAASNGSRLLGVPASSTAIGEITLGANMTMSAGGVLNAVGGGSGSVISVATGYGLTGGTITTTGTILADTATLTLKYLTVTSAGAQYQSLDATLTLLSGQTVTSLALANLAVSSQTIYGVLLGNSTGAYLNNGTGTANQIPVSNGSGSAFTWGLITNSSITNGTIDLTTKVTGILPGANGGTGANNGSSIITLGGSLTTSGAFASTFTMTGTTTVTFPTSGTLTTTANVANPTASVGLSAVNGSATTFMRSDAAPPLSQSIIPTMTGLWTFQGGIATSGNITIGGGGSTTGANLRIAAATYSDNTSSGTVAANYANVFGQPTFSNTSTTTYTIGATVVIIDAPTTSGGNTTLTATYPLYIPSGVANLAGGVATNGAGTSNLFAGGGGGASVATTSAQIQTGGSATISAHVIINGTASSTITANRSYYNLGIGSTPVTMAATGTHPLFANLMVNPLVVTTAAGTLTEAATVWIGAAATGGSTNWALHTAGNSKFDAQLTIGGKINITTGSNASAGTATLSSGTVTVSTTAVTSSSLIFVVYNTPSGTLASGLSAPVGSIVNATSFVINSLTTAAVVNTLDNSTVRWWIIN